MNEPAVEEPVLWLRTPEDVLAKIPFTMGFHPSDSLVVFTVDAAGSADMTLRTILAADAPDPPGPPDPLAPLGSPGSAESLESLDLLAPLGSPESPGQPDPPKSPGEDWPAFAHGLAAAMVHRDVRQAVVVAYTPSADQARQSAEIMAGALDMCGIRVLDVLWVFGDRWRSLSCGDERCCPPEGRVFDPATSQVAAESVYHGEVALEDEDELRRSIAPVRGPARLAMYQATARMDAEASRRYLSGGEDGAPPTISDSVGPDGKEYVTALIERCLTAGHRPTDDEVAWAAMYLFDVEVRDKAWLRMTQATALRYVQLWREIGCRAIPPYHVAPLTLLAFAAWLAGDGVLARYAIDRVLKSDPNYSMALLVHDIVAAMVPPSVWPPPEADEPDEPAEPDCPD